MKKTVKPISIVVSIIMLLSLFRVDNSCIATAESNSQDISYEDYEEISTPKDLDMLNKVVNGKYTLTADIDMSQYPGTYIPANGFKGIIQGNGHTIKGMSNTLIDTVDGHAEISNLNIQNGIYENEKSILINKVNGGIMLDNINVSGNGKIVSGLCGEISSTKSNDNSTITNCSVNIESNFYSSFDSFNTPKYVGGICASCSVQDYSSISISKCRITLNAIGISSEYMYCGGIIGNCINTGTIKIDQCCVDGSISNFTYQGGILGCTSDIGIQLTNCINSLDCISEKNSYENYAGGCIGYISRLSDININGFIDIAKHRNGSCCASVIGGYNEKDQPVTLRNVYYYNKIYNEKRKEYIVDPNAVALTDMQLSEKSSMAGLDFVNIFACERGVNDNRVLLRCFGDEYKVIPPTITEKINDDGSKTITIAHQSNSAKIIYSLSSDNYSKHNLTYNKPIKIVIGTYVTAYAHIDGFTDSEPVSFNSVFKLETPNIIVTNDSNSSKEFMLYSDDPDVQIYYTIDGSEPTLHSNLYTTPFYVTKTTVIKAVAVKSGCISSDVLMRDVEIVSPTAKPTNEPTDDSSDTPIDDSTDDPADDSADAPIYKPIIEPTANPITEPTEDSTEIQDHVYNPVQTAAVATEKPAASKITINKVSLKKMTIKKKKWYLSAKKLNGVSGYEMYIDGWEMFSKSKNPTRSYLSKKYNNKSTSWSGYLKLLSYNKSNDHSSSFVAFRVKIRGYKIIGGKYYYGKWSSWKSIMSKSKAKKLCDPFDFGKDVKVIKK